MPRTIVVLLAALLIPFAAACAAPAAAQSGPPTTTPTTTPTSVTDNPFIPPNKDLSTCVSANPQPGCGSSAHGGWRQFLVFVVVAAAMVFIGWRIVVTVRRHREEMESSGQR